MLLWGMAALESIVSCSEEKSLMVRFPDPKQYLLLKQLEEWNIIVSCDKLGDTLPAAPTCNQCASSSQLHFDFFFFILLWALIIEVYLLANVFLRKTKLDLQHKQPDRFSSL